MLTFRARFLIGNLFCFSSWNVLELKDIFLFQISFGWSSVKIDMSAAKRDPRPIIPFGLSAFAASLFALGLALGTTIAVGMLFIIQVSLWLLLKKLKAARFAWLWSRTRIQD